MHLYEISWQGIYIGASAVVWAKTPEEALYLLRQTIQGQLLENLNKANTVTKINKKVHLISNGDY